MRGQLGVSISSRIATRIAAIYLAISVAWILASDRILKLAVPDADALTWLQSVKGLGFVALSSAVIYLVTRRYLRRVESAADRLQEAYDGTLAGWASALDIRDRSTGQHTQRVTARTVALAQQFGIEGAALDHIRRGATLHDIGKMGVPDSILWKASALDDDERSQMRRHPELAMEMLSGIEYLRPALEIPWCHHERWDGTGYPRGLVGTQIPLSARIFAVVDVYDALTSQRPYREPITHEAALDHIRAGSGSHFDPDVVAEFVR